MSFEVMTCILYSTGFCNKAYTIWKFWMGECFDGGLCKHILDKKSFHLIFKCIKSVLARQKISHMQFIFKYFKVSDSHSLDENKIQQIRFFQDLFTQTTKKIIHHSSCADCVCTFPWSLLIVHISKLFYQFLTK